MAIEHIIVAEKPNEIKVEWYSTTQACSTLLGIHQKNGFGLTAYFKVPEDIALDAFLYCLRYRDDNLPMKDVKEQVRRLKKNNIHSVYSNDGQITHF